MKRIFAVLLCLSFAFSAVAEDTALTIYNQDFAVVRETLPLDLKPGINTIHFSEVTGRLEPDSVILRDPTNLRALQILEQNYRNDPVTQELLLSLYEGKTIEFQLGDANGPRVKGKVIRSGYVPRMSYDQGYQGSGQPIIEVDGQLRFALPGQPIFPALTADSILKPTLNWQIETDKPGHFPAELSYVTAGLSWQADYNLVAPEKGDVIDLIGWVTMRNNSGRLFEDAHIKLLAGDVNKLMPNMNYMAKSMAARDMVNAAAPAPAVTERRFDEYHMYTLAHMATLHDHETKQVEFVRATGIPSKRIYVYDGAQMDDRYAYYNIDQVRTDREYGTRSNPKVWVMQEFKNSTANHLGMPLPKGRLRFYRRDVDGHLEFTGENTIDHTPQDETVRVYTGNSFDLVGERKRTNIIVDVSKKMVEESFEITLRNHKKEAAEFRVVEHLYRGTGWQVMEESQQHKKIDSSTIEFRVPVKPGGEEKVSYTVRYTW